MIERVRVSASARAPSGDTYAYIVSGNLLIDPASEAAALDDRIAEAGVAHVAVTHHHPDHVGGVAAYTDRNDLTVWARRGREDAFTAATGVAPDRTFLPGDTLPGGATVIDTPGHTPEHVAFAGAEGIVTGDLAVAEGSVVVGAPDGDMRAYLSSLRRVHAANPDRLYPAHGAVINEPMMTCTRLIYHRLNRERRVLMAVREGATTPAEIVDAAYDKDLGGVRDLATSTVVAHLEKLAVERRLSWDGERASL